MDALERMGRERTRGRREDKLIAKDRNLPQHGKSHPILILIFFSTCLRKWGGGGKMLKI